MSIYREFKSDLKKLSQLLILYTDYYVYRSLDRDTIESVDFLHNIGLHRDKIELSISKIDPFTVHDDNEEVLPVFCQILNGGELVTCYEKEKWYCECRKALEECKDCGELICPNGCDDEEENNEKE